MKQIDTINFTEFEILIHRFADANNDDVIKELEKFCVNYRKGKQEFEEYLEKEVVLIS